MSLPRKGLLFGLALALLPLSLGAQVRDVVSKEVSVGSDEYALRLEFADESRLAISFARGAVSIDGETVGAFEPGDALVSAWRALLGQAVALDDGPLAEALMAWSVPAELDPDDAAVAARIDQALEQGIAAPPTAAAATETSVSMSIGDEKSLLSILLNSTDRLWLLESAFRGLAGDFAIHIEEDVVIPEGARVEGTLVVIGGAARVAGEVAGDVVVVDGTLELLDGSVVGGEVRLADARLVRNLGEVEGGIVDLLDEERDLEAEIRNELRDEIRNELRSELRAELRNELRNVTRMREDDGFSIMAPFRPVIRGVGGVLENLIAVFILGLIGAAAMAFGGEKVDVISETVRRSPGRAAMVGFAGSLLLLPLWILGAVALIVSIIGIPVAIAWLPLFPLVAGAAAVLGYLAVARNTGEWLADSGYPWTGWIRKSNPIFTVFGGLFGLMFAFIAANVISIAPFLGVLTSLLVVVGAIITFIAVQMGFGAVILTRGGRRRERWSDPLDMDAAWEAAVDVDVEIEPEPAAADEPEEEKKDDA